MNKDTFVPIGDEFINSIINSFRNNQNEKSSDDWFNNDQTFYEQLKRKYKYTTEDKKVMMFDIIVKEIKKEKNISEDEAKKIEYKIKMSAARIRNAGKKNLDQKINGCCPY